MEKYAKVKILTKEIIPTLSIQGPYEGSLYLKTLNAILRADKKPISFLKPDGSTAYTIEYIFDDEHPASDVRRAYEAGASHESAFEWILNDKGFILDEETGYVIPRVQTIDGEPKEPVEPEEINSVDPAGEEKKEAVDAEAVQTTEGNEEEKKEEELPAETSNEQGPVEPEEKKEEVQEVQAPALETTKTRNDSPQPTGKNKNNHKK